MKLLFSKYEIFCLFPRSFVIIKKLVSTRLFESSQELYQDYSGVRNINNISSLGFKYFYLIDITNIRNNSFKGDSYFHKDCLFYMQCIKPGRNLKFIIFQHYIIFIDSYEWIIEFRNVFGYIKILQRTSTEEINIILKVSKIWLVVNYLKSFSLILHVPIICKWPLSVQFFSIFSLNRALIISRDPHDCRLVTSRHLKLEKSIGKLILVNFNKMEAIMFPSDFIE